MQLNLGIVSALDDQIAALQKQKAAAVAEFKGAAIEKMKADIVVLGITATDLGFDAVTAGAATEKTGKMVVKSKDGKVEPKYIDPVSGKTWTGRGKAPKWIDGQDRTPFLIDQELGLDASDKPSEPTAAKTKPQDVAQEPTDTAGEFTEVEAEVIRAPAEEAA